MWEYETQHIFTNDKFRRYGAFYRRYIDDIFFMWLGPIGELVEFVDNLNQLESPVKLKMSYSKEKENFLDVTVYKNEGKFQTCIYTKPTDRNTILHYNSHHPRHLLNSMPKSQMLRVARIDSEISKRRQDLQIMGEKFVSRGYPRQLVDTTLKWAEGLNRGQLLKEMDKVVGSSRSQHKGEIYYVSQFGTKSREVKDIILKHWDVVHTDEQLKGKLCRRPKFSYSRAMNLKEQLSPSDPRDKYSKKSNISMIPIQPGVFKCKGCVMCGTLILGTGFAHPHTGKKYSIRQRMSCETTMVVYIIKCPCGLLYCGKTVRQLKERIGMHRSSIRAALNPERIAREGKQDIAQQPVAKHWAEARHDASSFRCMPIEHVKAHPRGGDTEKMLLKREAFWIHELNCMSPNGMNGQVNLSCFLT
ncbi:uncharacterized protein LOC121395076 [Xenopus laevis]|uniref:Uncharacterized protein LOC121395076 n=1 Tax=Xenopus laevis TaxID=8355 RepID=A0A8J1L4N8_XENLA|nr:uncharacterized protein LOC121395076 [Xenopus laevis]XP_041423551.1 uncharacterized protein LOC121395076 [Xenopus laevis]